MSNCSCIGLLMFALGLAVSLVIYYIIIFIKWNIHRDEMLSKWLHKKLGDTDFLKYNSGIFEKEILREMEKKNVKS